MPFENWTAGEELFNSLDKEHDILDRDMRPFAEESDQLRAFQIFSGTDDGWGGFTARYIDSLQDEFGKKDIWMWAVEDGLRTQRVCISSCCTLLAVWMVLNSRLICRQRRCWLRRILRGP